MNTEENKVKLSEKLGLLMVYVGNIPLMTLLSSYFLIYYTTVVGLDPVALATLFLISKIVDGISDPLMGFILDSFPVTKMGKFRPMLITGTLICVANYILLWFGAVWSPVAKYAIVYITYLLLGWTFDIMDISKNSLLPVMSADTNERNNLTIFSALGNMIGSGLIGVLAPIIVADGTMKSYYILIFGFMAFTLIFSIVGALKIRERVAFEGNQEEKYSVRDMLHFLSFKPLWSAFAAFLILGIGSSVAGGAGIFFFTYIIGDLKVISVLTIIGLVTALIGTFTGPMLAGRFGKKAVFLVIMVISVALNLLRLTNVTSMTLIYVTTLIGGIVTGGLMPINAGIQADNTAYVQYKTGKRAEAAIASLTSFIAKVAQGIGGALPGYILAAFGFIAGAAEQPESVHTGIIFCVLILPTILTAVGTLIFGTQYTLNKKALDEMNTAMTQEAADEAANA